MNETKQPHGPHQGQEILMSGKDLADAGAAMILIHGRGASAEDIMELSLHLPHPEAVYLAPRRQTIPGTL